MRATDVTKIVEEKEQEEMLKVNKRKMLEKKEDDKVKFLKCLAKCECIGVGECNSFATVWCVQLWQTILQHKQHGPWR